MSLNLAYKFPKLSQDSPKSRLKSRIPIKSLTSTTSHSQNSPKLLSQKAKMLRLNESLASKYFLNPKPTSSPSVSPTHSVRSSISKKLWQKELEKLNSKFLTNELNFIQSKAKIETLQSIQEEFLLYKDYIEDICGLYSNGDLGVCMQKAVRNVLRVFSKVLRKCTQSELVCLNDLSVAKVEKKCVRNSCVQTDDWGSDISEDELENIKGLSEKAKSVKISKVVDKLLEVKQAIVDMHTFLPNVTERPEIAPDSYKLLLRLISNGMGNKEKAEKTTETESEDWRKSEKSTQADQELNLNEDLLVDKRKIEELNENIVESENKIRMLEEQIFELMQVKIEENKNILNRGVQTGKSEEWIVKDLREESLEKEKIMREIEVSEKKNDIYEKVREKRKEFVMETEKTWKLGEIRGKNSEGRISLDGKLGVGKKGSKNKIEADTKDFSVNAHQIGIENRSEKDFQLTGHKEKIESSKDEITDQTMINEFGISEFEQEFVRILFGKQIKAFREFRKKESFAMQQEKIMNLEINSKSSQIGTKKGLSRNREEKIKFGERINGKREESFEVFEELCNNFEVKEFLGEIFEEGDIRGLSSQIRIKLLRIAKEHLSKGCAGNCEHLKRVMSIKKKECGILYPIKKIQM